MRRFSILTLSIFAVLALASPASAAVHDKVTGDVGISHGSDVLWATFDGHNTNPDHGTFEYTHFGWPLAGTDVWVLDESTFSVAFEYLSTGPYTHILTVDSTRPTSPTRTRFSGTGTYPQDPNWRTTFHGNIDGNIFTLYLTEIGYGGSYDLVATGTIVGGSIVNGTWSDNYGGVREGAFDVTNAFHEVLHYTSPVSHVEVPGPHNASFQIELPSYLGGGPLTINVHDEGPGIQGDFLAWGGTQYDVEWGNLSVFDNVE